MNLSNLSPIQHWAATTVNSRIQRDIDMVLNKTCCDFMSELFRQETVKNKLDNTCIEILNKMTLNDTLAKTLKKLKPNYTRKGRKRSKSVVPNRTNAIDGLKNMLSSISNELEKLRNNGKPEEKPVEKTCQLSGGGGPGDSIAENNSDANDFKNDDLIVAKNAELVDDFTPEATKAFPVADVVGSMIDPMRDAFGQSSDELINILDDSFKTEKTNPGNILLSQFKEDSQITNVLDRAIDTYIKNALNPYTLRKMFLEQLEEKTIQMIKQTDASQKFLIEEVITNKNKNTTMKKQYCKALCSGKI